MSLKQKILELRSKNKSYDEIAEILNCSKGTIAYHCGKGQKEKSIKRHRKFRSLQHPAARKIERFKAYANKLGNFNRVNNKRTYDNDQFTLDDVLNKYSENTFCYLTGEPINLLEPTTYAFDHIIPLSRGGSNKLDNLGITTRQANQCKSYLTHEEFIKLCEKVLINHGYDIKAPEVGSAPTRH